MASNINLSNTAVNAEGAALALLFDNGFLRLYDGTQPATADTAITTQVLLAEPRFATDAIDTVTNGLLTANPLTADNSANASGSATWYRVFMSDGTTPLVDGSVGTSDADCIMATTAIQANAVVSIASFTHQVVK